LDFIIHVKLSRVQSSHKGVFLHPWLKLSIGRLKKSTHSWCQRLNIEGVAGSVVKAAIAADEGTIPEGAIPVAPAPGAGGMAMFAGGVVIVSSLYISKFGELDFFAITPQRCFKLLFCLLRILHLSQTLPNLFCSGFMCLALSSPT
jgi:hypothetical protein